MIVSVVWASTDHDAETALVQVPYTGELTARIALPLLSGPELIGRPWVGDTATVKIGAQLFSCEVTEVQSETFGSDVQLTYSVTCDSTVHEQGIMISLQFDSENVQTAFVLIEPQHPDDSLKTLAFETIQASEGVSRYTMNVAPEGTTHTLWLDRGNPNPFAGGAKTLATLSTSEDGLVTRYINTGDGLAGGGDLSEDRTHRVVAADATIEVSPAGIRVASIGGAHGDLLGGSLHALATVLAAGFMSPAQVSKLSSLPSDAVPSNRNVTAGAGLAGGGNLAGDIAFDVVAGDASVVVGPNSLVVGVISDAQHGARGGGDLHDVATGGSGGTAGFMSPAMVDALTKVKVSDNDSTENYLLSKLSGLGGISFTELNNGANELVRVNGPSTTTATATGDFSTSSTTAVLVGAMTLTPPVGTYLVLFASSAAPSAGGATAHVSIYVGGVIVAESDLTIVRATALGGATQSPFCCVAKVTVNGSQAIEGRVRVSTGSVIIHQRTLAALETR